MNETRTFWLNTLIKIVNPVLDSLSRDCLHREMPVESKVPREEREPYTYLEAFARTLVGLSPWLGCKKLTGEEEQLRQKYAALVRRCLDIIVDPNAQDKMNFSSGRPPIVNTAFLAQGILRAPDELWAPLSDLTKERLLNAMRETRTRKPGRNNWLLFSAMIECLLHYAGAPDWDPMRIDYALLKHMEWYKGDGWYGDGKDFHFDYYNSYVIQPMLLDVLAEVKDEYPEWAGLYEEAWLRASHYATHLEHLISPEGTYPLVGRSLTYRMGTFHTLAMAAYHHKLEETLTPAQVRCALTAVMKRLMAFDTLFDENGWLKVGICGNQPGMGEIYISTGSLYLFTEAFLPLGLTEDDPFWSTPDAPWTMKLLWGGQDRECEHALGHIL